MAFVASAGSVQALSRSTRVSFATPSRIQLSSTYYVDYAEIYRNVPFVGVVRKP